MFVSQVEIFYFGNERQSQKYVFFSPKKVFNPKNKNRQNKNKFLYLSFEFISLYFFIYKQNLF